MSIGPHIIDAMIAAGASAEILAAAWKADLAEQDAKLADKRAKDADRQRRHRQSRDVTVTECDSALPPSPNKSPPDPQKLTPTPVATRRVIPACARHGPPDGVSTEQWTGFLRLRTAKRQPMTERGYSLLAGKLRALAEHGFPPGEMIDLAIERGWTTVHEPKETYRNGSHQPPVSLRGNRPDPALDMLRRAIAEEEAERSGSAAGFGTRSALPAGGAG